jgi:exonuclease III
MSAAEPARPQTRTLRLVSLNVGGLGAAAKIQAVLHWARTSSFSIIQLQEVHGSTHPLAALRASPGAAALSAWGGSAFWCPGSAHSRGCLTLVKAHPDISDLDQPDRPAFSDPAGRILRVDLHLAGQPASLLNIYAPAAATAAQRAEFFAQLAGVIPADRLVLL